MGDTGADGWIGITRRRESSGAVSAAVSAVVSAAELRPAAESPEELAWRLRRHCRHLLPKSAVALVSACWRKPLQTFSRSPLAEASRPA